MLQEYLSDFNEACPLFDRDYIVSLHQSVYGGEEEFTTTAIAALCTTIGIAHRLRAMSPLGAPSDDELAQTFIRRVLASLPEMLIQQPTLVSAQCLVGLAVILHGTADPEPAFGLITLALRMVVDLLYFYREDPARQDDFEQLSRVYWISSHMEVDLSIRTGRWYTSVSPENGVALPEPLPVENLGQVQVGQSVFHIFVRRSQLVQIQHRLVQAGFLFQTSEQEMSQIHRVTTPILNDLKTWREGEPHFHADPDGLGRVLHRSDMIHTIILEAVYFNAYFALWSFRDGLGPFKGSVMKHLDKYDWLNFNACIDDARRLLKLLAHVPQGNYACMWLIIEAVVSALYVVLNAIVRRLTRESRNTDLALSTHAMLMVSGLVPFDIRGDLTIAANRLSTLYDAAKASCTQSVVSGPLTKVWSNSDNGTRRKAFFEQLHRDCDPA